MYKGNKILVFIPARGETKKISKKNTKLFDNEPLFTWALKAVKDCLYVDKIIISTEDDEVMQIANYYGDFIPFKRPKELSKDNTPLTNVIIDTLVKLKKEGEEFDYILTLLPTQPLIKDFHITNSIEYIIDNSFDSIIAVTKLNNDFLRTFDKKLEVLTEPLFKINNSIFINKLTNQSFNIYENSQPFIIEQKYDGNIDSSLDWEISEMKKLLLDYEKLKKI